MKDAGQQVKLTGGSCRSVTIKTRRWKYWRFLTMCPGLMRCAPSAGLGPGFHLAKTYVVAAMPAMQTSVSQLAAGQYNYLPTFVGQVQDALSKVHTMIVYSDKSDQEHLVADLSAQISQALAFSEHNAGGDQGRIVGDGQRSGGYGE